jgi:hypothetical protein
MAKGLEAARLSKLRPVKTSNQLMGNQHNTKF